MASTDCVAWFGVWCPVDVLLAIFWSLEGCLKYINRWNRFIVNSHKKQLSNKINWFPTLLSTWYFCRPLFFPPLHSTLEDTSCSCYVSHMYSCRWYMIVDTWYYYMTCVRCVCWLCMLVQKRICLFFYLFTHSRVVHTHICLIHSCNRSNKMTVVQQTVYTSHKNRLRMNQTRVILSSKRSRLHPDLHVINSCN